MPNFVYDDTALLFPKTNLNPLPAGGDPTQYVQSVDWNTLSQATEDIKNVLRGAQWYGVEKQAVDPAPAAILDYLWADVGGSLYFHTGGGDVLLTPAVATVTGGLDVGTGVSSISIFKQLSGGNLEFKGIRPASNKLTVVDAVGTDDVDLNVVEANLVHQSLSGAGSSDHAAIDAQLPSTVQKTDLGQLDGAAQGTIWFSNVAGRVTRLAPGTAGQSLKTGGAAVNPAWGAALVSVQDEGSGVASTPHAILNFVGAGVAVTDGGAGIATVTISGAGAGNSLDEAYTQGQTIDIDLAAMSLTNAQANTNNVLELNKTPGAGNDGSCLVATMESVATDWTGQFIHSLIGNVSAPSKGIVLSNPTPAITGATNEQFSPMLALVGSSHDVTIPHTWTWGLQNQTLNGVSDESHLHFLVDDNAGGFISAADLDQLGELTLAAGLTLGSGVSITSAGDVALAVADLDLQAAVTTLDIKGGVALSVDGVALTTGLTAALLSEAMLFFTNTGLTGAEAETLTDGSNADTLHAHAVLAGAAVTLDASVGGVSIDSLLGNSNWGTANSTASTNVSNTISVANTGAVAGDATLALQTSSVNGADSIVATSSLVDLATNVTALDIQGGTGLSIDGTALTVGITSVLMDEMLTFFGATGLTGAEAETLSNGSNADALHAHAALAATSANISIVTTTGGDVDITAAGGVDINGATIGIFGATSVAQQVSAANLTNSVTAGGTDDTITDFTDLTTYATDAAAIRNAIYQLSRKLKQVNDGLRAYGWLT